MKLFLKRFEKTYLFLIKALLLASLFVTFFGFYMQMLPQLEGLNRTSVVSFVTFLLSIILFIRIYGGFSIGERKSRPIVNTMFLATLMADFITFIITYIMGISTVHYHDYLTGQTALPGPPPVRFSDFIGFYFTERVLPGLGLLVIVLLVQVLLINAFTYFGNFVYFKVNDPRKALIIYHDENEIPNLLLKISKYRKQWVVNRLIQYDDPAVHKEIVANEAVFFADVPKNERSQLVEYCYKHNKDIFVCPDVSDIILNHADHLMLDDTTVFASTTRGMSFEQLVIKRLCDILFSVVFILITSPIMIAVSIAIKAYDHGPVLYKQKRLTKGGREFNVLKFRSMIVDAEKNTGAMLSTENDSRITPVGKWIRRFRVDELPQLFNILKGDMSVVGPRPERLEIAEEYEKDLPEFRYRLKVQAGLTGLAQIMSKYNTAPKDKLALDLVYIEQYSIWLDIKLMLQTLVVFVKSDSTEGVHEEEAIPDLPEKQNEE